MGYTGRSACWRVEIPLAMPVIVAGLRIATVTTIGLVTVTRSQRRIRRARLLHLGRVPPLLPDEILTGAVLSVVLAVTRDLLFVRLPAARHAVDPCRSRAS